ncbi:MAG: Maf family nucleotide pyrophosphatase [Muribaculaceae bacterium]
MALITDKKIYLASASPRRRQLLQELDIDIQLIQPRDIDETYPENLKAEDVAEFISREKAAAYLDVITPGQIIITADTVVICDGQVLGKPHGGEKAAADMLHKLSGKTHLVVTGVSILQSSGITSFSTTTEVHFDTLTDSEIDYYVTKYAPFDKAGAYGIQEWIGYIGIKGINGCYYNVMGLPLHDLYRRLSSI